MGGSILFCMLLGLVAAQDGPIVNTTYGPVQGVNVNLASGAVIQSYLGIPFAKAPVGVLRFEPPVAPDPWTEVLDTSDVGYVCMQGDRSGIPVWDYYENNEDCLNMNIYSKQREGTELHPVMVWIHGGGFNGGVNFEYPGYFLAEKDVVYVGLNYRLGIFGFAYTGDDVVPGNMGLWDNIMALQFIRDNIASFGGDPNRVTLFGQSSGGSNIGCLESAPQAEGLFHGAILQSGAGIAPWSVNLEKFGAENYMYQMAAKYFCDQSSMQAIVDCLRNVPAQLLADTDNVDCPTGSTACQNFQPVVDGNLIPDIPMLMRERGEFHKVPEMVGLTEEDGFGWGPGWVWQGLTREEMEDVWRSIMQWGAAMWPDPTSEEDAFQATNWYYADWPYINDTDRNRDMLGIFLTDYWYGASADYQAKSTVVGGNPAYFYVYKYLRENDNTEEWRGTGHSAELRILFGFPLFEDNPEALAHSQYPQSVLDGFEYTQRDKDYSDFMSTLWTNFAKYWDPTPEPVELPGVGSIDWNSYALSNLSYAYLDVEPYTAYDYRQQNYAFQNRYLNYMIYGVEFYDVLDQFKKSK